jgi:hypothetical protein
MARRDDERPGDPENTIEPGKRWTSDDRDTFIERNEDGSTTFHRYYGGEWHQHTSGGKSEDDDE